MSNENQVITNTVEKELPLYVRNAIWFILERERENHQELHCFELDATTNENGKTMQKIMHTHRIPAYQHEHLYTDESPVKTNIVIKIEGSGTQTMMLADELKIKN